MAIPHGLSLEYSWPLCMINWIPTHYWTLYLSKRSLPISWNFRTLLDDSISSSLLWSWCLYPLELLSVALSANTQNDCSFRYMVWFKIGMEKQRQLFMENGMKACIMWMETLLVREKDLSLCQMRIWSGSEADLPNFPLDIT